MIRALCLLADLGLPEKALQVHLQTSPPARSANGPVRLLQEALGLPISIMPSSSHIIVILLYDLRYQGKINSLRFAFSLPQAFGSA